MWLMPVGVVRAESDLGVCVDEMSDEQVVGQLAFMRESFAKQRRPAIMWWTIWTGFNAFNTVFAAWQQTESDTRLARDSWLVSWIGAGAFVLQVSALPMTGMYGTLRMSRWAEDTASARRVKLKKEYKLLARAAWIEDTNSNLTAHILGFAYAVGSTGYVWARNTHAPTQRLTIALSLQFVTSVVFAEMTLWTVPRKARRDLRQVEDIACGGARVVARDADWVRVGLRVDASQVGFVVHF